MKAWATAAAILALSVPAAAQQSSAQQKGSSSAQAGTQTGTQSSGQQQQVKAMSQQKLRDSLQKAGFQDIKIVDAAYVVHARTSEGQMVVMYIDPPSAMRGAGTTGAAGSSDSSEQDMKEQSK
jgi:hypothetical protein